MLVQVRDNNVDQALKALKKKMQREGIFREMKLRNYYEKPSEKRVREQAEAVRRARKLARKRAQREGLLPGKAAVKPGAKPGRRPSGGPRTRRQRRSPAHRRRLRRRLRRPRQRPRYGTPPRCIRRATLQRLERSRRARNPARIASSASLPLT